MTPKIARTRIDVERRDDTRRDPRFGTRRVDHLQRDSGRNARGIYRTQRTIYRAVRNASYTTSVATRSFISWTRPTGCSKHETRSNDKCLWSILETKTLRKTRGTNRRTAVQSKREILINTDRFREPDDFLSNFMKGFDVLRRISIEIVPNVFYLMQILITYWQAIYIVFCNRIRLFHWVVTENLFLKMFYLFY